jgi:pimeloyl-ACP methyl ester carboxylesterase
VNAEILARCIPHARLHVIPDGHLFLLERPEPMAELIRRCVADASATP